jgi:dihydrolipoamide dehydrogenase
MSEKKKFDIVVVGAGPGGYTAAIRASQLGKTVALVEKEFLGGTCLNVGCIPSKTLLSNAAALHQIKRAKEFGITTGPVSFHYEQWKLRKDQVVEKIRAGLKGLIASNKITVFEGAASFLSPQELKIKGKENLFITAEQIILATGSIPLDIKAFPCDGKRILNSTSLLNLTEAPKSLCIVGGGYIGCEFASLFIELGTKVVILEALPSILAAQGSKISQFMSQTFKRQGIEIQTNVMVKGIENRGSHVSVALSDGTTQNFDLALVAVGRKMYTEGLMLEKAGLTTTERGALKVNHKMETEVRGIYAIGDVTGQSMLAHVAAHQGMIAGANAAGYEEVAHYTAIPAVIFTSPEVATVGLSLEEATKAGYQLATGSFPFQALGKAVATIDTEGFSEIIADSKTGQILGATIIGHEASNLIAEMALAIQNELDLESVIETIHAHPTMAESWHETVLLADNRPINFPPRAKKG